MQKLVIVLVNSGQLQHLITFCRPNKKYKLSGTDDENELPKHKKQNSSASVQSKKVAGHPAASQQVKKMPCPPQPLSITSTPGVLAVALNQQSVLDVDSVRTAVHENQSYVQLTPNPMLVNDTFSVSSDQEPVAAHDEPPLVTRSQSTVSPVHIPQPETGIHMMCSSTKECHFGLHSPSPTVVSSAKKACLIMPNLPRMELQSDSDDGSESSAQTIRPCVVTPRRPQFRRPVEHLSHPNGGNYQLNMSHRANVEK